MVLSSFKTIIKITIAAEDNPKIIGNKVSSCKVLTNTDQMAPQNICIKPIKAEALPAFLAKGARDNPAVFGLEIPMPLYLAITILIKTDNRTTNQLVNKLKNQL